MGFIPEQQLEALLPDLTIHTTNTPGTSHLGSLKSDYLLG